jgi:hypothetical protein
MQPYGIKVLGKYDRISPRIMNAEKYIKNDT